MRAADERAALLRPLGLTPLLTTAQLMARYGVSNWTVNQWVQRGCPVEPTAFRGRRFDLTKVEGWIVKAATPEGAPPIQASSPLRECRGGGPDAAANEG